MKQLTYILLLLTLSLSAQPKGMVRIDMPIDWKVEGKFTHVIQVADSAIYKVGEEWEYEMKGMNVHFQKHLRKINQIVKIPEDRIFVASYKNGTIYLNENLDEFPNTKRVVILQQLFIIHGGKVNNKGTYHVNSNFKVSAESEDKFTRQRKYRSTFYRIKEELQ